MSPQPSAANPAPSFPTQGGASALEDQEESVRIAVRALGDMRNGAGASLVSASPIASFQPTPALSTTSRSSSPSLPSPSLGGEEDHQRYHQRHPYHYQLHPHSHQHQQQLQLQQSSSFPQHSQYQRTSYGHAGMKRGRDQSIEEEDEAEGDERARGGRHTDVTNEDFVSRVSHFPLVNSALRVYEHSKASSRVVKYGAEMMESSVKSISKPVIDRLPVNQLDEFACRQLDRLGSYGRRPVSRERTSRTRGRSSTTTSNVSDETTATTATTTTAATSSTTGTSVMSSSASEYSQSRSRTRDGYHEHERLREGYDVNMNGDGGGDGGMTRGWTSAVRETRGRRRGRRSESPEGGWKAKDRTFVEGDGDVMMGRDDEAAGVGMFGPGQSHSRTPTPRQDERTNGQTEVGSASESQQQVVQRSRWQAVLLEAGGIGAAVSEESMRRLKYCLQWLQYATEHIDAQILILRDFIASLQQHDGAQGHHQHHHHHHHHSSSSSNSSTTTTSSSPNSPLYSPTHTHHPFHTTHTYHPYTQQPQHPHQEATDHLHTLTAIRRDVVDTIRQVVDVVSKYAGGALPEPARARVRSFILCLPQRWATVAASHVNLESPAVPTSADGNGNSSAGTADSLVGGGQQKVEGKGKGKVRSEKTGRGGRTSASVPYSFGEGSGRRSRPVSRATSPSASRNGFVETGGGGVGVGGVGGRSGVVPMAHAAQKILTLATESLDMLRAVTQVFKESLDKADAWVERLRIVGVQRPSSGQLDVLPPPALISHSHSHTHPSSTSSTSPLPSSSSRSTVASSTNNLITTTSSTAISSTPSAITAVTTTTTTTSPSSSIGGFGSLPSSSSSSNHQQHHIHLQTHGQGHSHEYREPLPPIVLTPHPGSPVLSNAPSPSSIHTTLPPLQSFGVTGGGLTVGSGGTGGGGSRPGSSVGSPAFGRVGGNVALPGVGAMFGEMSLVGGVCVGEQQQGLGLSGVKRRDEEDGEGEGERESKRREVEDEGENEGESRSGRDMDQDQDQDRDQEESLGLVVDVDVGRKGNQKEKEVVKMEVDG